MPILPRPVNAGSIRRLMLAALLALTLLPLLGWWLGELRTFATVAITLSLLWWLMAGVAMWQQRRRAHV